MNDRVRDYLPVRRRFLKIAVATGVSALSGSAFAGTRSEQIKYWDNHAGFGYAGPRDVDLLDRWRSAGVNYLSINVGYDPVPWRFATVRGYVTDFPTKLLPFSHCNNDDGCQKWLPELRMYGIARKG